MKIRFLFFLVLFLSLGNPASAADITLIYTGETHAMLYPCDCPREPDGGVSRRATMVSDLRKKYPQALVVDAGGFFAGGAADEYSQNTEIDMRRTDLALEAMKVIGYDCAALSDDEFNFGADFLRARAEAGVPFLSCTMQDESGKILPFLLKDAGGITVALIGVTPEEARRKASGISFRDPKEAVAQSVKQARLQGAQLIIVLSQLGEHQDRMLLSQVDGIDVVVSGQIRGDGNGAEKIGSAVYLRPAWQGRRLGVATLHVEEGAVSDFRLDDMRVSRDHADDPRIQAFLPQCFVDANCRSISPGSVCQNGGTKKSACVLEKGNPVSLTVITSRDCLLCSSDEIVAALRERFTGLKVTVLQYHDAKAKALFKDMGAQGLPVFLLGPEVELEKNFDALRESLEKKHGYYMIKPHVAGMAYLVTRPYRKGAFDLFVRIHDPRTPALLESTRAFNPAIHVIAEGASPAVAAQEREDCLRAACVGDLAPESFAAYVSCRAAHRESSWWEDCAPGLDVQAIRDCARSERGEALLSDRTALTRELKVGAAPTYLLDNQQIFSTDTVPSEAELKSIMKR